MPASRNESTRSRPPTRKPRARGAAFALLFAAAPLLTGCDPSIGRAFRQSAQEGLTTTIKRAVDNFFDGVNDVLEGDAAPATTAAAATDTAGSP